LFNVVDELERSENVEKRITICANPLSVCQAYDNNSLHHGSCEGKQRVAFIIRVTYKGKLL
jgi:hypothetical protein